MYIYTYICVCNPYILRVYVLCIAKLYIALYERVLRNALRLLSIQAA